MSQIFDFSYTRIYRGPVQAVLLDWARWLAAEQATGREVVAYLDNTMTADHAVRDARRLAELLEPTVSSDAVSPG